MNLYAYAYVCFLRSNFEKLGIFYPISDQFELDTVYYEAYA